MDRLVLLALLAVFLVLGGEALFRVPVSVLVPDGSTYRCGTTHYQWERTDIWDADSHRLFDLRADPDADYFDYPAFTCHRAMEPYGFSGALLRVAGAVLLVGVAFGLFRRWVTKATGARAPGAPSPPLSRGQKWSIPVLVIGSFMVVFVRMLDAEFRSYRISLLFVAVEGLLVVLGIAVIVSGKRFWQLAAGAIGLAVAAVAAVNSYLPGTLY